MKEQWLGEVMGGKTDPSRLLFYRAMVTSAGLGVMGVPSGGYATFGIRDKNGDVLSFDELAFIPSDGFAGRIDELSRSLAGIPATRTKGGYTVLMPFSSAWLANQSLILQDSCVYYNHTTPLPPNAKDYGGLGADCREY